MGLELCIKLSATPSCGFSFNVALFFIF